MLGLNLVQRGQYIFSLAGGCACHTCRREPSMPALALFRFRSEKFTARILPKTKKRGLGSWTDQQIQDAIVKGIRRDGRNIIPVMPYEAYSGMAEEDLKALICLSENAQTR